MDAANWPADADGVRITAQAFHDRGGGLVVIIDN
jgi:hypothetical protein